MSSIARPGHRSRPRERDQRGTLGLGAGTLAGGQRVARERLRRGHRAEAAGAGVDRLLGEDVGAQRGIVAALGQREVEVVVVIGEDADVAALGEQHVGLGAHRSGRQVADHGLEQLGQAVRLAGDLERVRELQQPGRPRGVAAGRQ
ncbi:MAG TPA: hypothetical protein VFM58_12930, partial [Solirubrobacteraceae bacterium]|nr:hypothetical protein [Solirubrobacteraceae bacterium]